MRPETTNAAGSPILTRANDEPTTPFRRETEFSRFRNLTEALLQVPKTELDEKREKS
jgi:hypothetical protein